MPVPKYWRGLAEDGREARWARRLGLRVVFQPIVELGGARVHGYEALLRGPRGSAWESPERLFTTARALALERRLDTLALRLALATWHELEPPPPAGSRLFLNVRAGTLLRPEAWELLGRARLPGDRLVLELSEAESHPAAVEAVLRWREGESEAEVAVDDFGSGYSNLLPLMRLRPGYVKFDRALTRLVAGAADVRPVMERLVDLVRQLGGRPVAEGIERPEELERLRQLGIDYGQGWLLGRPAERPPVPG
ncbi:MAG: EAL domain-containing protein [Clostridia bacterium]|nr:EAL domain-containing protein [Clostridia bacterium]